ncbi:MAG: alpha-glucoside transport system substrate-binding protein, partial [Actinomycetota bacterium]|nr:alpha-glucoside transport system substrate-binding protein [Actinomycetota bacterium]
MRRRTLPKAAALLAATTLMTTGCLSQSNSADNGGGGGSSKGNQSKTVEIMLGFTGDQLTQFKQTLEPYAKSKGITIKWSPTDNFNQLINTRVQGNSPPDIAMFPQPGILLDLANKGKLAPLDDFLDMGALQSSMTTGTLDAGSTGGHLYGLLASMNVKSLVFYPKKAFESAGYTAPKSIPELIDLTDRIKADGKTPWCLGIESGAAPGG